MNDEGKKKRVLIAAGGTGGHVFPALAIAEEMKKINSHIDFLFVGTRGKIESRVVPEKGYSFTKIWISGFHRSLRIQNLLFPIKVIVAVIQSFILMKRYRPGIVIGTGGYVCGPVLFASSMLHIPTVIHESNSFPGITTRLLSTRVDKVFTAFESTKEWLKRSDNVDCVGTPTRSSLVDVSREEGLQYFHLQPTKRTILVFGGSLGASSINEAVSGMFDELIHSGIQIVWQTGRSEKHMVETFKGKENSWVGKFIDAMDYAYACADIVVCRSGATTLAELTRLGKASILGPYPYAAADHQTLNAQALVRSGAAILVHDNDVKNILKNEILALLNNPEKQRSMSEASRKLGKPHAGNEIARKILEFVS